MLTKDTTLQRKSLGLAAVLLATLLIFILTLAPPTDTAVAINVQPELLALAAEQPDTAVRVMIQTGDSRDKVKDLITNLGGVVIKDLSIINAVVAEMEAKTAVDLALDASVNWVSLDSPVVKSQTYETFTVRDEFNNTAYSNNDGSAHWASDWQEGGESNGPSYGDIRAYFGRLLISNYDRSLERSANLSGAETAVLTFDYRLYSFDSSSDYVTIEISSDGGNSWHQLDQLEGPANDCYMRPASYDISAYANENSAVRFITSPSLGRYDRFYVDNVQIEYTNATGDTSPDTPDAPVDNVALTVEDDFEPDPPVYNNNSGTRDWTGGWYEVGENNGPYNGSIYISNNQLGRNLALAQNYSRVWREVNLAGASYATLKFDYASALYYQDELLVEMSTDGGATWSELDRISIVPSEPSMHAAQYDISQYISWNTAVRFTAISKYNGSPLVWLDNIKIEFDGQPYDWQANYYTETLGLKDVWAMGITGQGVTVAVIDSGISDNADFYNSSGTSSRLLVQENFYDNATTTVDNYGHGTHIAGIIAGNGAKSNGQYKGVAPDANLIGLKISDDAGVAYESDTIEAMQWVLDHKDEYNIRVVNLSVNSAQEASYHVSPMNAAAEILWFNGIVVITSAGNRDTIYDWFNPVIAPPANDPFVITVGASSELFSGSTNDDYIPFFSAQGTTVDGYEKPDIIAPGQHIISVLSANSWWRNGYPSRVVNNDYFRISGTSMSTPMVAGAAALLLQAEPGLTPDQVKYRLIHTARSIDGTFSDGEFPYLDVYAAVTTHTTESANTGIQASQLLWTGSDPINWGSVNWGSVNWGSVNWGSVNWGSVNWGSVNWGSVSWDD